MDPVRSPLIEFVDGDIVLEWRSCGNTTVWPLSTQIAGNFCRALTIVRWSQHRPSTELC